MATTTGLAEDACLLHFTIELFQRNLKRTSRTHNDLAHAITSAIHRYLHNGYYFRVAGSNPGNRQGDLL